MNLPETCLHCAHADFKTLWKTELRWFAICNKGEKWRYHAPELGCDVGKFEAVSQADLEKRIQARKKAA